MNLMETIHLHKNDFSKTEHKVYDYIVQNPTAIETATITKIAELCQVSTSGILRFCQVLGYKGYKDFRFDMLHYLHQEHVEVNPENLFDELTSKYLSVIRQFNNIDQNKLNQLIKQIKNYGCAVVFRLLRPSPAESGNFVQGCFRNRARAGFRGDPARSFAFRIDYFDRTDARRPQGRSSPVFVPDGADPDSRRGIPRCDEGRVPPF